MIEKHGYVYILTNVHNKVLYTGVTSDLVKRVYEHKNNLVDGFTKKYNVHKLVHFEVFDDMINAITREKQIKGWLRSKKIALIESVNPEWKDLYEGLVQILRFAQNDEMLMKTYTMTETAKKLGVHRQTMINWIRKGWVKPKRDYKDWPVFTDECIAKIKEWRETLREE